MKFKLLADTELQNMETEFVQFLVSNGIDDDLWRSINADSPDKAIKLVEMFSDVVWEKALKKVEVIEHYTEQSVKVFWYLQNKAVLVGVNAIGEESITLNEENWINLLKTKPESFELFSQTKKVISENREVEIFKLLESGCQIGSLENFRWLNEAFQQISKTS